MTRSMRSRTEFNEEILVQLRTKEAQYGVQFVTVQIQSATPPEEVVQAIKDRMVAQQKKEQADAEAAVAASLVWGLSLLAVLSYALARAQRVPPWKVIGEHVVIGLCVVAITHYLGDWVRVTFG